VHRPPPLARIFFWDLLSLLLAGGDFAIVEAVDKSEGASGGQQANLVAKVAPEPLFQHSLQRAKLRKGYLGTLELV